MCPPGGRIPSLSLLPVLLLMKPRTQLAFTLPAHVELLAHQHTSQVTLARAALSPFSSQYLCLGCTDMYRTLHLALLNFIRITQAHLKPLQAPLDGIPSLQSVNSTTQVGVHGKVEPLSMSLTKMLNRSQYQPLRNDACHWSAESLSCLLQLFKCNPPVNPYSPSDPAVKSMPPM